MRARYLGCLTGLTKDTRGDGHDTHTSRAKVTGHGESHGSDATLGSRVSNLARLAVLVSDGCSVDNYTAFTYSTYVSARNASLRLLCNLTIFIESLLVGHDLCDLATDVEGTNKVDTNGKIEKIHSHSVARLATTSNLEKQ